MTLVRQAFPTLLDTIRWQAQHERQHFGGIIAVLVSVCGQLVGSKACDQILEERGRMCEERCGDGRGESEEVLQKACEGQEL